MTPEEAFSQAALFFIPRQVKRVIQILHAQRAATVADIAEHLHVTHRHAAMLINQMRKIGVVCVVDKRKACSRGAYYNVYSLGAKDSKPPAKSGVARNRAYRERKKVTIGLWGV